MDKHIFLLYFGLCCCLFVVGFFPSVTIIIQRIWISRTSHPTFSFPSVIFYSLRLCFWTRSQICPLLEEVCFPRLQVLNSLTPPCHHLDVIFNFTAVFSCCEFFTLSFHNRLLLILRGNVPLYIFVQTEQLFSKIVLCFL